VRTAAILPVKRFRTAKQRLGASVGDQKRVELARAMVADVLGALARSASLQLLIVVTDEPSVAGAARGQGALVLADTADAGQSAAVEIGVRHALAEGIERVLCVPGDCPALDAGELERLLCEDRGGGEDPCRGGGAGRSPGVAKAEVVIVPDRHGTGTNGLLLTPPDAIRPSFGPGSAARHRALARAAAASWRLERVPSLLLDIDTGEDLAALRGRLAGTGSSAVHTRAVLDRERPRVLSRSSSG
jgi:2-phospho-L-lactate/phosphoenolpyruvate guanylyltransferase